MSCVPLNSPQPTYEPPAQVADEDEDKPVPGAVPRAVGPLEYPELAFGAAALSGAYNDDSTLNSDVPLRTVRLALRYGIRAFDTSPYYGVSEIILGKLLADPRIARDFPRSSYKITTKCGRYGYTRAEFDYAPTTLRASVRRSLDRLRTDYVDVLLLHDVEFVCAQVRAPAGGKHLDARAAEWGLAPGADGTICGPGDETVLAAVREMFRMKDEGLVRAVGISGYPLPTLLRLARLIAHHVAPLDTVLSYSNYNLQNAAFAAFAPHLKAAGVRQLGTASPFNMGLLTPNPPPWHPAPPPLQALVRKAGETHELPALALGFSFRRRDEEALRDVVHVVGLSKLSEVHQSMRVWREVNVGVEGKAGDGSWRAKAEEEVRTLFREGGWEDWSWASPPDDA
ncbi:Aldo/keto reductase [Auricularia subglabra TFB-10046 SS5]|nr:Aldo/keto reductase [Auricularia subglabra TFB-10046 SS5]